MLKSSFFFTEFYYQRGEKSDLEKCISGINPLYLDMQHVSGYNIILIRGGVSTIHYYI